MKVRPDLRVGWCPGALTPMMSGDGLIVRVKPRGATVKVEHAIGLAGAAVRHGNGLLDLTARANLQIRGVREASLPALTAELDALGLLDADAGAEARRNVVASPLMGLDPSAAFDIRPAVAALEARLAAEAGLAGLPSKFGAAVSDGGAIPLDGVAADLRFEALPDGRFAVRLDGDEAFAGVCAADEMPEVAVRLARAFLGAMAANPILHRMRDLVAVIGAAAILEDADLKPMHPVASSTALRAVPLLHSMEEDVQAIERGSSSTEWRRGTMRSMVEEATGPHPSTSHPSGYAGLVDLPGTRILGVAAPFGRLDAAQFDLLARYAVRAGAVELRVTPWRALLVPGLAPMAAARLAADCAGAGFIVDAADPRLAVAACPGAPGCRRATTPVLDHAGRWAKLLGAGHAGRGIALHVAGCAKGCAHPGPASLTLVAEDGLYALVTNGTAADAVVAAGLDPAEVPRLLETMLRPDHDP